MPAGALSHVLQFPPSNGSKFQEGRVCARAADFPPQVPGSLKPGSPQGAGRKGDLRWSQKPAPGLYRGSCERSGPALNVRPQGRGDAMSMPWQRLEEVFGGREGNGEKLLPGGTTRTPNQDICEMSGKGPAVGKLWRINGEAEADYLQVKKRNSQGPSARPSIYHILMPLPRHAFSKQD